MQEKDILFDLMKSVLGYIVKENEALKKENRDLIIKQAKREAEDHLFQEAMNEFASKIKKTSLKDIINQLPDDDGDGEAGA